MDTKLIAVVSIILTLSVASERLVEIIKGFFPRFFGDIPVAPTAEEALIGSPDPLAPATLKLTATPEMEAWRKAKISILAVACGIITAFLASPIIVSIFKDITAGSGGCLKFSDSAELPCIEIGVNGALLSLALGLLASGGSALWHSILEYLLKLKDLKKIEVKKQDALGRIEIAKEKIDFENKRKESLSHP